jgi:serine/threonine protein phosphatase PrpC
MSNNQSYIYYYTLSDKGSLRESNEDYAENLKLDEGELFVVCDGMGGHKGGQTASTLATQAILDNFELYCEENNIQKCIEDAVHHANEEVYKLAKANPELKGMGTTCVIGFINNYQEFFYGHVGDSRVYIYRNIKLQRLTKDHSWVQFLADSGKINESEMENHPEKNRILRAVGSEEQVKVDVCIEPLKLQTDDIILICSDGLSGMISDKEISNLLSQKNEPEVAAKNLLKNALDAGGKDNITITVIHIKENPLNQPKTQKPSKDVKWIWLLILLALILSIVLVLIKEDIFKLLE